MWQPDYGRGGRSSFQERVPVLADEPDAAPLVSVTFAAAWLPYVCGALQQLVQPSAWDTTDSGVLLDVQQRAMDLIDLFCGQTGGPPMQLQFTADCVLQYSADGGATWTDVPGCVNYPPGGYPAGEHAPPNPQGVSVEQQACNIAYYLANLVLKHTISAALENINNNLKVVDFAAAILAIVPGLGWVGDVGAIALGGTYNIIESGTKSDYTDALADDALWAAVQCSIYGAIRAQGHLTPGNFAATVAAVGAVTYAHADVLSQMTGYMNLLGYEGIQAISQIGSLAEGDCMVCGSWCYTFNFLVDQQGWVFREYGGVAEAGYEQPDGFVRTIDSQGTAVCGIWMQFPQPTVLTAFRLIMAHTGGGQYLYVHVNSAIDDNAGSDAYHDSIYPGDADFGRRDFSAVDASSLYIQGSGPFGDSAYNMSISSVTLWGEGPCPFGVSNC